MEQGIQVQVRVPKQLVNEIDSWVEHGRFSSRSDAIKSIVQWYDERDKTRKFYDELERLSVDARKHPEKLTRLEDL